MLWLTQAAPLALSAAETLHVNPFCVLAQWAVETGWGQYPVWTLQHNPGGVTGAGGPLEFADLQYGIKAYVASMMADCPIIRNHQSTPTMTAEVYMAGDVYNTVNKGYARLVDVVAAQIEHMQPQLFSPPAKGSTTAIITNVVIDGKVTKNSTIWL